jgi:hypothetical protein
VLAAKPISSDCLAWLLHLQSVKLPFSMQYAMNAPLASTSRRRRQPDHCQSLVDVHMITKAEEISRPPAFQSSTHLRTKAAACVFLNAYDTISANATPRPSRPALQQPVFVI